MQKKYYEHHFNKKKITIMGLGLLGRGVQVAQFLADSGAVLTVTDLKTKDMLQESLKKLSSYKNIKYVLGRHDLKDFEKADMVIKAAGVPLDSQFIKHAKDRGIDIAMDASLFARLATTVRIVGVTGTRGKSMTTSSIFHVLKASEAKLGAKVYAGGNLRGMATLPLLKKVKDGDIVVLELDSWQCQGFGDEKISPEVAVFTSFMPDHMNYYAGSMKKYFGDKANIFKYQSKDDFLVIRPGMKKYISKKDAKGWLVVANSKNLSKTKLKVVGAHQVENLSCAYEVGRIFGLKDAQIMKSLSTFKGLEGRLEFLREYKGVKIYNDNNSTTPEAASAGLSSFPKGKILLICGGSDKALDLNDFAKNAKKLAKTVFLTPGTGTDRYIAEGHTDKKHYIVRNLQQALIQAIKVSKRGDVILFSPAFASFGLYNNEYERNDEFVRLVKKLKI